MSKCYESTPTHRQKKDPSNGLPTLLLKLKAPVSIAKTVASIWLGVILANRTTVGSKLKARDIVSEKTLVNATNAKSLIPSKTLSLSTNIRLKEAPNKLQN